MNWNLLILSLPTENATLRMRAWRNLKSAGAAVLRDGVYLLPELANCRQTLDGIAADVTEGGGTALVLNVAEPEQSDFKAFYDRSSDYAKLIDDAVVIRQQLTTEAANDALKQTRKLRKQYAQIAAIDFFPDLAQRQADGALKQLERAIAATLSPDEPQPADAEIARLDPAAYQAQRWATRRRPWVDRLASAWLIKRFIDPQAQFVWLETAADCPANVLGFDFDGARFTHVGDLVTFEVLLASFGLEQPALQRIGTLVHFLDVGGIPPAEASGVESVLKGLRESISDDDRLLNLAQAVFDGLYSVFQTANSTENRP
ncbi:chromate resistance protein [Methylomonas sp. SURF-1]|uniref:Chromate resistance protein n=1 Tax=Methylomonas aurea TaxID=2952224 RepID=A0ABT1UND2_9GAMM|nr:chromate resistance protein ChrB domain-containing protein [Methylomonas sp. SURF-1]MCQ8183333.1 chromate resistance protein [Methylomonas sp. SURF-1]